MLEHFTPDSHSRASIPFLYSLATFYVQLVKGLPGLRVHLTVAGLRPKTSALSGICHPHAATHIVPQKGAERHSSVA